MIRKAVAIYAVGLVGSSLMAFFIPYLHRTVFGGSPEDGPGALMMTLILLPVAVSVIYAEYAFMHGIKAQADRIFSRQDSTTQARDGTPSRRAGGEPA